MIVALILFLAALPAAYAALLFTVLIPKRLDDPAHPHRASYIELRARAGGVDGIRRLGFLAACIAFVLFAGALYAATGRTSGGAGLRLALQLIAGGCIGFSILGAGAYQFPLSRHFLEMNGQPWEEMKGAIMGIGIAGATIFGCSAFIR